MTAWERDEISDGHAEKSSLGWVFAAALACFILVLLGLGTFLRYIG